MTKEDFILILNKELHQELSVADITQVLTHYCIDKGAKDVNLINQCINIVLQTGQWSMYFNIAKKYYYKLFRPDYLSQGNTLICYL